MKRIEKAQVEVMLRSLGETSSTTELTKVIEYPPAEQAWLSGTDTRAISRFKDDFFEE